MNEHERCRQCGAEIEAENPGGLCPRCLLKLGIDGSSNSGLHATLPAAASGPPERIGAYRILDPLGEGGMGIVYLAEQTDPIQRRVAIKVIKPGMDSRQVLARFEAERQALAIMSHPNVAKVFDAGATEQGRPYFVMEYVPGVPITEYCDMHCLPLRERLELFTTACAAIQHAHQKGIIHRDMKPSNVLVSSEDGKPMLKVIDFGVAKAMGQQLTERTLFTRQGVLLGTPEYMSPEQAGKTALDVDARTDIYSLGVMLYELLVGALPFDAALLRRAAAVEMMRIIREEDPPTPTTRFSSLGDTAPEVARRRHTDVRSLARLLHGELEWITMRALEKDPARRYPSASELAADIRRHLSDEPVVARPPGRSYLMRKFARKHRAAVTALAASLLVLLGGVLVSTALYLRSESARARAEMEAVRNRLDAEVLQAALRGDTKGFSSLSEQAMALHRRALGPGNPALAPYLVNQLVISEFVFGRLPGGSEASVREALDLTERALDAGDTSAVRTLLLARDDGIDAPRLYGKAFELVRRKLKEGDPNAPEQIDLLADLLETYPPETTPDGERESAERIAREILELRRKAHPSGTPQPTLSLTRLADLLVVKADRLRERGDPAAAAAAYRESVSLVRETGPGSEGRLAQLESDLGGCLTALGKLDEAEPLLTRSHRDLELLEGKMGEGLVTTQQTLNRLVDLYTAWGKPEEAARYREMLPAISVSEVRDLGRVRFVPQVFTRGGGLSASFGGRSAWVFKETRAFGRGEAGPKRIDSSWGLAETATSADLPTVTGPTDGAGNLLELIPRTAQEPVEDWSLEPGAVVWDGARDRALVFYAKKSLHALEQRRVGSSLALWPRPDAPAVRPLLRPGAEEPTLLFDAEEPAWGSGALTSGNWLYTYACKQQKGSLEVPCLLARVPLDRALDRGAWTFYAGGSWSSDWRGATAVIDAVPPMSVAWNGYLGKYVAVSTRILSDMIRIRTADRPEGPWSEAVLVQGLAPAVGFPWIGPGIGHPELAREGGRVEILTYTRAVGIGGNETRAVEIEFRKR